MLIFSPVNTVENAHFHFLQQGKKLENEDLSEGEVTDEDEGGGGGTEGGGGSSNRRGNGERKTLTLRRELSKLISLTRGKYSDGGKCKQRRTQLQR